MSDEVYEDRGPEDPETFRRGFEAGERHASGELVNNLRAKVHDLEQALGNKFNEGCYATLASLATTFGIQPKGKRATYDDIIEHVSDLNRQISHWKANHDEQVRQKAAVLDRPDLRDRAKKVMELVEEGERLRAELVELTRVNQDLRKQVEIGNRAIRILSFVDHTERLRAEFASRKGGH